MALNNPDILLPKLDELVDHLQKWNERATDITNESDHLQRISTDQLATFNHYLSIVCNEVEEDGLRVANNRKEVKRLLNKCEAELVEAKNLQTETENVLLEGQEIFTYWKEELSKALSWLARAKERRRIAEIDLANAQSELGAAQNELANANMELRRAKDALANAIRALNNCRNSYDTDREGRRYPKDCSYYESAVRDAEARVVRAERDVTNAMARLIQAEDWVRKANQELNDARAEVKEAQLRVEWCQKALNYSKEGMIQAKAAHLAILYSLNMAERSYEEAQAAEISQQKATARHKDQMALIAIMNGTFGNAASAHNDARRNQISAVGYANTSQNLASNGLEELGVRIDYLVRFAQPITFAQIGRAHV